MGQYKRGGNTHHEHMDFAGYQRPVCGQRNRHVFRYGIQQSSGALLFDFDSLNSVSFQSAAGKM
jgi:hypothetical protein